MLRFVPIALAVVLASPLAAQDPARMDALVSAEADSGAFMGTVLVAKGDEVLFEKGYGSADLEWGIPNSPDAKYRIGSVTKQFTAAAILKLQEEGKLDLDDPVKAHLADAPSTWDAITLRHLAQHTSGIPNVTSFDEFGTVKMLPTTREELIDLFADKPLEFEPGSQWSYSNSGYLVLSAIVEDITGQSYQDYVDATFFTPLAMDDTEIDRTAAIVPKRANGYSPSADGVVNAEYVNMAIPQGAGALFSTSGDLLKWQRGLFGGEVLSDASLDAYVAATPTGSDRVNGGYGLGVIVSGEGDERMIWHGGGIEGFNSWLGYDPDREITVVVLANLNGGTASTLGPKLMTLARGGEMQLPGERTEITLPAEKLTEYEGVYALAPTFKITITREGDQLMGQATGQGANPIFAESEDMFFLKVVDAQLRFNRNAEGEVESLTLFQGGAEQLAPKE